MLKLGSELFVRAVQATRCWHAVGAQVTKLPLATILSAPALPTVWDANCVLAVQAHTDRDIDAVLAQTERTFGALAYRRFICDPLSAPPFEARLVLEGYAPTAELQHLLLDAAALRPLDASPALDIRPARVDCESIVAMLCEETAETSAVLAASDFPRAHTAFRLAKGIDLFAASLNGEDVGHVSSWAGPQGIGKVEYLFVRTSHRGRGIARALIAHAVEHLARLGISAILIGSCPHDWPRLFYARLGFRPLFVKRSYHRAVTP